MNTSKLVLRFALVLVAFLLPVAMFAQTSNGTVVGTVTDQSGAVVPKASVKAESIVLAISRETTTDASGGYRLESLAPGTYSMTFTAPGFDVYQVNDVLVEASISVTTNAKLNVSQVKHTVVVEAQASQQIDTQSGQMGTNLNTTEVLNLPQASLNPAELALTLPGVQDGNGFGFSNGINFSVNGTRPRGNNFLIDGQDDNDYSISGQAFQPTNVGAVEQVTVLTNAYSAEYGRGGGSVTNYVFGSGTNQFHGKAWEIANNSEFAATDASTAFAGETKPVNIENTFGFNFGGPVLHNKLFVFGTAQWDRDRSTANGATLRVPTDAGIATLQAAAASPSITPAGLANINYLLANFGTLRGNPNASPSGVDLGSGRGIVQTGLVQRSGVDEVSNDRQWDVRLDYHVSSSDTLYGSYLRDDGSLTPDFFANAGAYPGFDSLQGGPSQLFRSGWTRTIGSNIVNELRFSYTNIGFVFGPTAATSANPFFGFPAVSFGAETGFATLGFNGALPQGRAHKTWQLQEALSYTFGRHTIKGGIDLTFLSVVDTIPFNSRGSLSYNPGGGFTSLGNFIDDFSGTSGSAAIVFGNPVIKPNVTMYMPYIQDTWRVKDNLTVTFGLRYEYWGVVENSVQFPAVNAKLGNPLSSAVTFPGSFAFQEQPDRNNFGPRFGFAYTPHILPWLMGHDKTVIRAGYGVFYDGLFTNILDNTAAGAPNVLGGQFVATASDGSRGLANLSGLLASIAPVNSPLNAIDTVNSNLRNPLTQQWNLEVQRELPGRFILTTAYVGTRGQHLFVNQDLNPLDPNQFSGNGRVNPGLGDVLSRTNGADSWYHSGQVELERRFHTSVTIRASYTYSKFLDDGSEVFTTTGGSSIAEIPTKQSFDWGPSAYDRRHRFVLAYVWDLPYIHGNTFARIATKGFTVSGIGTVESGTPDTMFDDLDVNGDGRSNDRPVLGNPAQPFTSRGFDGSNFGLSPPGTFFDVVPCFGLGPGPCVPESANAFHWLIPAIGTPTGNVGRNSFFGPGQWFWNTSVQKRFDLPFGKLEQQALTFRCEAFNVLNHPNLFTPTFNLLDPEFAQTAPTIAGARSIKFWLTYSF
jgi:outer membrane receptor protein involved in Fe transport